MSEKYATKYSAKEWMEMFPSGRYYDANSCVETSCRQYTFFYRWHKNDGSEETGMLEECGVYSLRHERFGDDIYFLEELFEDPINPTPEEMSLFELEHGFTYELKRD